MDFKVYQSHLSQLSARFNLMVFLVLGLLIANVLLSGFLWKIWREHPIEITPFSESSGYIKSESKVDSHYLSLMSENFIYSRLNVTPETVVSNHKRLLMFVDSKNYSTLLKILEQEAKVITSKKMSSVFAITGIEVNPNFLTAKIHGVLKRYVGFRALKEERPTYFLRFRYAQGRLTILSFTHTKENENAKA